MAKASKILSGRRAKHTGQAFEQMFEMMCARQNIVATRIPDGCKQIGTGRIVRVKTPFDYIISCSIGEAIIDTKTLDSDAFPHSAIEPHQAMTMVKHEKNKRIKAGYVVYLRKAERIIFIPASTLCAALGIRGSMDQVTDGVIDLGHIQGFDLKKIFFT